MKRTPAQAWRDFRDAIEARGGQVIEPEWLGARFPHRVICAAGHETSPRPSAVLYFDAGCNGCAGRDQKIAWQRFRDRVIERGGEVLEPEWMGSRNPHRIRCSVGHEVTVVPAGVLVEGTWCRVCAQNDPKTAERAFHERVTELGGRVVEAQWLGVGRRHKVVCGQGHDASPRPADVQQGKGICRVCARQDPDTAWREFHARVAEMGGCVVEPEWLGSLTAHRVVCRAGHRTTVKPNNVQQRGGLCRTCSGHDGRMAEEAFRKRIADMGATLVEPMWLGTKRQHRVICAQGHACHPTPNDVQSGCGVCRICAHRVWDVFYVVTNDSAGRVKFGITSNDARKRLSRHWRAGYRTVVRTLTAVPDAQALERSVLATLRLAGFTPVHGCEYFDTSALPVILDIVDNWISPMPLTGA